MSEKQSNSNTKPEGQSDVVAVKKFIEQDSGKVPASEMMKFWKSCNKEERAEFGKDARGVLKK